jgi:hypothetical protein
LVSPLVCGFGLLIFTLLVIKFFIQHQIKKNYILFFYQVLKNHFLVDQEKLLIDISKKLTLAALTFFPQSTIERVN